MKDGRIASGFLSAYLEYAFDGLTYVDRKGYDYEHKDYPYIEQKLLTRHGLKFCPSAMTGVGRKVSPDAVDTHIKDLDLHFLIPSIVSFPLVQLILIPGTELQAMCTNKQCSFTMNQAMSCLGLGLSS